MKEGKEEDSYFDLMSKDAMAGVVTYVVWGINRVINLSVGS